MHTCVLFSGAAYAYEDETSSDSDDDMQERFRKTKEATIKRSASTYSRKSMDSPTHLSKSNSRMSIGRNSQGN